MTTIVVTGASGNLGSALLPWLTSTYDVRPVSRRARPGWIAADLAAATDDASATDDAPASGSRAAATDDAPAAGSRAAASGDAPAAGLRAAVQGADIVVHLASSPTKTRATDVEGTRRLARAAADAGVRHFLYMSIIGIDRVPLPYYRMKLEAEAVVRASGIPFTLLRAAQFPELINTFLTASSRLGPVLIDRRLVFQPVAVEDVAAMITSLVAEPPTGGIVEFGGPERLTMDELATAWKRARRSRRPTWPIRVPGRFGRELRAGALTTSAEPRGTRTWQDYLTGLSAEGARGRG